MEASGKRYLKQVRGAMACPREDRERLLSDVRNMLDSFSQENPRAFYSDYVAAFGSPKEFAGELLRNLDPELLRLHRQRRRRFCWALALAAVVLAVFLLGRWSRPSAERPDETTPTPAETDVPVPLEPSAENRWEDYLAKTFRDAGDITYKEGVAAAVKLGILSGKEDGAYFDPAGTMTRAEAAKLITIMLLGGSESGLEVKSEPPYPDIKDHWAEAYIDFCYDMDIILDHEAKTFGPNEEITFYEILKLALGMLGYNADAYQLEGPDWMENTNLLARYRQPSLYIRDEGALEDGPVTREETAQIFYCALQNAPIMAMPLLTSEGIIWQFQEATLQDGTPDTFLHQRFGLDSLDQLEF